MGLEAKLEKFLGKLGHVCHCYRKVSNDPNPDAKNKDGVTKQMKVADVGQLLALNHEVPL